MGEPSGVGGCTPGRRAMSNRAGSAANHDASSVHRRAQGTHSCWLTPGTGPGPSEGPPPSPALASQLGAHTVQLLAVALWEFGIRALTPKKARPPRPPIHFPSSSLTSDPSSSLLGFAFHACDKPLRTRCLETARVYQLGSRGSRVEQAQLGPCSGSQKTVIRCESGSGPLPRLKRGRPAFQATCSLRSLSRPR